MNFACSLKSTDVIEQNAVNQQLQFLILFSVKLIFKKLKYAYGMVPLNEDTGINVY